MRFLHTMVRVRNLEDSLDFWCNKLGLVEVRRIDVPQGRYTLVFLAAAEDEPSARQLLAGGRREAPSIELTYNWDAEDYGSARNFGHVAFEVDDIYAACAKLQAAGVTINRPPRDGQMAFVRSPDLISVELLQKGAALPPAEPWASMPNVGVW
jgi:lactoylglutathione lyase